jgi:PAS domain S-box-containing protein
MKKDLIFIIDDEELIIESIKDNLETEGFNIISANNGKSGLKLLDKYQPELVILDLKMPVMNGIEFLKHIKLTSASPFSVIVLTGHGEDEDIKQCFNLGISAFLRKPFNIYELLGMIRHAISIKNMRDEIIQNQEIIRKSEEKYRSMMNYASDAIIIIDSNKKIIEVNNKAVELFGYTKEEFMDKYISELIPKEEQNETYFAFKNRKNNKTVLVDIRWSVVKYGGQITLHGIVRDVTEKMNLYTETIRTSQLITIGELAAGVAHEINNPIYGIMNYAQIIMDESKEDESKGGKIYGYSKEIISETERVADIVRTLLDFARNNEDEKSSVQINDIISNSLKLIETQLKKEGIILKTDIPADLPEIVVNSQKIQQVFLNILQNARYAVNEKYFAKDGDKVIEIICRKVSVKNSLNLKITFKDGGNGIPEDIIAKVMNPFFTTKPPSMGTGLGLSISQNIINAHRGKIKLKSKHGQYTMVIITLPCLMSER